MIRGALDENYSKVRKGVKSGQKAYGSIYWAGFRCDGFLLSHDFIFGASLARLAAMAIEVLSCKGVSEELCNIGLRSWGDSSLPTKSAGHSLKAIEVCPPGVCAWMSIESQILMCWWQVSPWPAPFVGWGSLRFKILVD